MNRRHKVAIIIFGLGCHRYSQKDYADSHNWFSRRFGDDVETQLLCNPSFGRALKNVSKTVCRIAPSVKDPYVIKVMQMVMSRLIAGHEVYLMGLSYGGSVAVRVAEAFARWPGSDPANSVAVANRLRVATFGSVYVPLPEKTRGVRVAHYMYENDVARRCNRLNPNRTDARSPLVRWLPQPPSQGGRRSFKAEWQSHNDYFNLLAYLVRRWM